ncbi:ABC transporter permease [Halalkalibacter nanhaiisediminis]|uniref:ABC-2 type transport system permease protein n=1 Tax=Halalkalibacter nanhaiisediminis TaxID=688079 RepID=A0A562QHJ3_9BACI|nr:ABC transporter permease [Halalkalibacter nanhaiisediminis]TWI56201.1 ABC-2 type transport system permease protein [Halalkalibacter nanhaiisediminis]
MRNFWIIAFHTYLNRLLTKTFLFTTIITLLFVLFFMNMDRLFMMFESDAESEMTQIVVVDETNKMYALLEEQMAPFSERLQLINSQESSEQAKQDITDGIYDAALVISNDEDQNIRGMYFSDSLTQTFAPRQLEQALQHIKETQKTVELGLSEAELEQIYTPIAFDLSTVSEGAKSEDEIMQAQSIVYILLFIIYISVLIFGNMIATEIATEKSSRVMEILVSSVSPITQMFGKIVGIGLLALTQYGILFLVGLGNILLRSSGSSEEGELLSDLINQNIPLNLIGYAIVFFILGYFLYATLAATLGSLVSRIEDVNQMLGPVNFLVIGAFFIAMFGLNAPESTIVTISSYIPFFAPMLMFLRVGILNIPIWEVALSIGILVATIILLAMIGARIFKGGVLMYGKSSILKDIKKALQLSRNEK